MNYKLNVVTAETDTSRLQCIAFEVYVNDNRYVGNETAKQLFDKYCEDHKCSGFLGPEHNPDGFPYTEGKAKPHRHGALWIDKTKDHHTTESHIDYDSVSALLESVCVDHPNFCAVENTLEKKKSLARYSVHKTASSASKEQFDFADPLFEELELDEFERNKKNGLVNIYGPTKGFIQFGSCNFINLITLTIREKAQLVQDANSVTLSKILKHVYDTCERNYTDLMFWCIQNNCVDVLCAFNCVIKNVLSDMKSSRFFNKSEEKRVIEEQSNKRKEEDKSSLRDQYKREAGIKKRPVDPNSPEKRKQYAFKSMCAILATCSQQYKIDDVKEFVNDMKNVENIENVDTFMIEDMLSQTNDYLNFIDKKYNTRAFFDTKTGEYCNINEGVAI